MKQLPKDSQGNLLAYAFPGGYPIIYLVEIEGMVLCSGCAEQWLDEGNDTDLDFLTYYEGPTLYCDYCNTELESAYGDPDGEEDA